METVGRNAGDVRPVGGKRNREDLIRMSLVHILLRGPPLRLADPVKQLQPKDLRGELTNRKWPG